jgi:2-dehydropantoate 2-reductase
MVKVCVFGGGAIGGNIAGRLSRAGQCEISVVDRGPTLEAIQRNGIRVVAPDADFTERVHATSDTRALGVQDYVFLSLKAHFVDGALDDIAPLIGPRTTIIPPTTGIPYYFFHQWPGPHDGHQLEALDPGGRQWRALPPEQVLGCVYWIGAHVIAPGVVAQDGAKAGCPVGELDGGRSPRAELLAQLLTDSGIGSKVNPDIRAAIWVKFVNSLCLNPAAILTQATLAQMDRAGDVIPVIKAMMDEADAVASTLGLRIPQDPMKRITMTLSAGDHKMSMLQDLEAGRPTELAILDTSIKAMSQLAQVPTPTLDAVLSLARLRAQTALAPATSH